MSNTTQQQKDSCVEEEKQSFWTANNGAVELITATLSWDGEEEGFDEWGPLLSFADNREPEPKPVEQIIIVKSKRTKMIKLGEKNILDKIEKWLNDAANEDTDVMDFLIDELGVKITLGLEEDEE
tara:strand:- start:2019 stop:2393 length:375 start_codon:yes stop_codon:yes gene_type:complete